MSRLRVRLGARRRPPACRKLHVGCFDEVHDGWLNTDVTPHLLVARVPGAARAARALRLLSDERWERHRDGTFRRVHHLDAVKPWPWPARSFEAVFCSHVLEHLTPAEAERMLREARRALGPDGVLRVAVPDLDAEIAAYRPAEADAFLEGLLQSRERTTSRHRHWWHYNETTLRSLLERTGFREIERRGFREGRCPDVERIDNRPGSLVMEARP